jgi:16S rRNA (adenine1518-N6/adenine1519-N6)-dimethyltransferase
VLGAAEIRELALSLELKPTKKLGQNFVIDPNTIHRIVTAAHLDSNDLVVEIGPGLGSLTLGILAQVPKVIVVEIDPRLADLLPVTVKKHSPDGELLVVLADAMKVTELPGAPTALVANLPYNISVPVLLTFMQRFPSLKKGLVMVQAEVAHRLAAGPGSKEYGSPSLKMAWYGPARLAGNISRSVFWPIPGVDSALVYFETNADRDQSIRAEVFSAIDHAFLQRRKTLRQALGTWAGSVVEAQAILLRAGIDPSARGEQLNIESFIRIAQAK